MSPRAGSTPRPSLLEEHQCLSRTCLPKAPRAPRSFGILSSYPPTACGLATFTAALASGMGAHGAQVGVVRVIDTPGTTPQDERVVGELMNGSPRSVAATSELLNQFDVALVQHEYGLYGGIDGDEVIEVLVVSTSHPS